MKVFYFGIESDKNIYVEAVDMTQAINKVKNSGVVEFTTNMTINQVQDVTGIASKSTEEVNIYIKKRSNGDQIIFPVKEAQDIINAVTGDTEVEEVVMYTEKGYLI